MVDGVTDITGAGQAIAATVDEISQFIDSFNVPFYSKTVEYKQGRKKIVETTRISKLDVLFGAIVFVAAVYWIRTMDPEEFEVRLRPLLLLTRGFQGGGGVSESEGLLEAGEIIRSPGMTTGPGIAGEIITRLLGF